MLLATFHKIQPVRKAKTLKNIEKTASIIRKPFLEKSKKEQATFVKMTKLRKMEKCERRV
jgi:hypothetical protein